MNTLASTVVELDSLPRSTADEAGRDCVLPTVDRTPTRPLPAVPRVSLELGGLVPGTRYRLHERIAERATAEVYGAVEQETGRELAIKVLRREASAMVRRCFFEEIRLTRLISSRRVVMVVDSGHLPDGCPWYAMTRPRAVSLRDLLRDEPRLPVERVVRIFRNAALAVGHAHASAIVHRDIKPSNLLVVDPERSDRVVLIDFGIACEIGRPPLHHSGTPRYMPPEQLLDAVSTPAMDIYALGCCAYEMLVGRSITTASTFDAVQARHARGLRPRWFGRTPMWLREVVGRCIDPHANARYPHGAALASALSHRGAPDSVRVPG